jgi:hypothetical protein
MSAAPDELAIAEARLMIAACVFVDATRNIGSSYDGLVAAVAEYRAALQGTPLPPDHPLVAQGMAVVRRLLGRQEDDR